MISIALVASSARSQTAISGNDTTGHADISNTVFGLGADFSALSGEGISMRMHFPERLSLMFTGYIYRSSNPTETMYDYGVEGQYDLVLRGRIRFYLLAGASHYSDVIEDRYHNGNQYTGPDRLGGGFGIETTLIGNDLCVSLSVALTFFQPSGDIIPLPQGGIHYYFR
ncbi:MAG TPA: hypothetical protein VFH95_07735 [Candidatus Kapabacteria bacterium]|nr:hypothetical protein [Candidatus Kapabacteria bacterium]